MNLMKIKLTCCRINDVQVLVELPNLVLLHLYFKAYSAEKLVFGSHAFPKLRKFFLEKLVRLRELTYEKGTSPQLESIHVVLCGLIWGLDGIKHLTNLTEISIKECALANEDML